MKAPTPRKRGQNWNVQCMVNGQRVSITAPTKEECLARYYQTRAGMEQSTGPNITLGAALDNYIASRSATLSPSTIRGYKAYRNYRYQSLMSKPVRTITRDMLQRAANNEAREVSAKTLRSCTSLINSVLRDETGHAFDIRLPQVVKSERPYLDPDDIPKFLSLIRGTEMELACLLGLWSLRCSELYAVTKADLDTKRRLIYVRGSVVIGDDGPVHKTTNKNSSSNRTVPMCDRILELYPSLPDDGPVVTVTRPALYKRINVLCRNNDLPLIGVHGLRHSAVSLAYSLNWPKKLAMEVFGYSDDGTMERIYTHLAQRDRTHYTGAMLDAFNEMTKNNCAAGSNDA